MQWDQYYMDMLPMVAAKSKDLSTKTSCIVVGPDHEIRSLGFNGFPRGCQDDVPERLERPEKYFWTEHAERNAVFNAARAGIPLNGSTAYVSGLPCMDCARALIQVGCVRIVYAHCDTFNTDQWKETWKRVPVLCRECGVSLEAFLSDS